jgi:GR25 family glycosyltransferase involved in LPS biosynthesis
MIRKDMDVIIDELVHGPISHVPGQVARMEAALPPSRSTSQPALRTDASPTPDAEFDQIYVLNMASDTAKLAHLSEMFGRHRVSFVRFAAIDGNDHEFDAEWAEYEGEGPVLAAEKKMNRRLIESSGAWGYIKTMQAVLEDARSHSHRRILIFDDDVMLHRDFQNQFAIVWAELPDDWKLVYLGSAQADPSKLSNYSDHLHHPGGMANGSYAIAMDSSVIDQALTAASRFDWPFDSGALREIDVAYPTKVFAVTPPLAITEVSVSSIRKSRDMDAHVAKHGWNLADYEPSHTSNSLDGASSEDPT